MQGYASEQLRNIVLMGHGGAGKTTLAEAMLFASGATSRMGSVDHGNTVSDFDEQEHLHRYSVQTAVVPVEWSGTRLNLLDAPGYPDFEAEVVSAAAAAEGALIAVDATAGPQAGTDTAWRLAQQAGLARGFVITRCDREQANFSTVVDALRAHFGTRVVAIAIPIGAAHDVSGIADVITGEASNGPGGAGGRAPDDLSAALAAARDQLIEAVAETDDALLSKYLDGESIGDDELTAALAAATRNGALYPVMPTVATGGIGVHHLLERVIDLFPSPVGRARAIEGGEIVTGTDDRLVVHVFKTTVDPFVGRLSYLKVLSGTLHADASPWNVEHHTAERLGHLYLARGKEQIAVPQLAAGDIGVAAKLAHTTTGDTLVSTEADAVRVPPLPFPVPTYRSALHPHSKDDVDKLSTALARITEQDPTVHVARDAETGELVLTTIADAQAALVAARLAKNFGVTVDIEVPRVPYRETITATTRSEFKHKKQTGGHGQYGHVVISLEPVARGEGFAFAEHVVGGTVPRQFIPAVEKGIAEALPTGPLAHAPIVDVRVTLLDGSAHAVDSSEMAFKIAAQQALKQGILDARPILLEPLMQLEIHVPSAYVGDVMSDLNTRRGHAAGIEANGETSIVRAEVPLAEVQRYAIELRALTHGRGSFTIEPSRYAEVPAHVQEQVLRQLQPAHA